jgi:tetratricopeptide (TPR) repeat protein
MLLDFHLAHEVRPAAGEAVDRIGGTPGYMSPEQQRCVDALRAGRSLPLALDPRSDIYSLGVLLYESLVGRTPGPDERRSRRALRKACPIVGRGLEDLLHKCLAWNRESRYADAGELAADLRRQMANLPLRGVANRSLRERWRKWRRRKPHALGVWAISLAALAAIGGACGFLYSDRAQVARTALRQAAADLAEGNHAAAVDRLTLGLQAARWLPGQRELKQSLQSNMADARRAGVLAALRGLVEQLRFLDSADDASGAKLRELDAGCRAIWEARRQIVPTEPRYVHGELDDEQIDLLDLALLWTRLMTRYPAASDPEGNRSKALSVLDEAERMWGPRAAIGLATAQVKGELAASDRLDALLSTQPRTSWEHDAVGRILMQSGMLEPAREQFELATRRDPGAFWPNFHLALCAYRSERFDEALRAACVCVALSPRRAECFFNRGLCYRAIGETEAAQRDFERAIELDPNLAVRVKSLPAISASK